MSVKENKLWGVLVVEDSLNDFALIQHALEGTKGFHVVHHSVSADDAMQYLGGRGVYEDRLVFPMPGAVVLDLAMPGPDGFELLEWLQAQPFKQQIITVVLSGADNLRDRMRALNFGADCYIVKSSDHRSFDLLVAELKVLVQERSRA